MRRIYGFFVLASIVLVGVLTAGCPKEPTELQLSHSSHNFGTTETQFSFYVWVTGGRSRATFRCTTDQPWLDVDPARGIASSDDRANEIVVTIDRGEFESGTYEGTVTVSSLGLESKTFKVRASVGVTAIGLSETSHDFGPEETDWSFDVWNAGDRGTTLAFSVVPDVDWLSVDPEEGASTNNEDPQTIAVTLHRDLLEKANYSGTITVTSDRGEEKTIAISARDPVPAIGLSETSHNFGTVETTWSFDLYNNGEAGSVLNFTLSPDADWLTVSPDTGVSETANDVNTIQVTVDRGGLEQGNTYNGQITVSAPGAAEEPVIDIVMEVATPALAVSTHVLDFGSADTERTFDVWNPGQAGSVLGYTVEAPDDPWISVAPASGSIVAATDPDTIAVTIDRSSISKAAQTKEFDAYRTSVGTGDDRIDVAVVGGTPRQMGVSLGELMADEIAENLNSFQNFATAGGIDMAQLDAAWAEVSPHIDRQFIEEMEGVAEGLASEGFPNRFQDLVRVHMIPVISSYSCSAIAVWGEASQNGHLYQIRNLDWELESGAQDHPWVIVYHPDDGIPHANVGFAGMLGCITGISSKGIALSEVGDSPSSEQPYDIDGEHFATLLRKILYDADNLTEALDILKGTQRIKRYHYVFGDGKNERKAVKIKAHAPETPPNDLIIYTDDDPDDPVLDEGLNTFNDVVYHAEGRDPKAHEHLTANYGAYDGAKMVALSREVATQGSSVLNAVYDATSLEMWVAFAEGPDSEAYEREYVYVDLHEYFELPTETQGTIEVTSDAGQTEIIEVRARTPEPAIGVSANAHDFGLESTAWEFEVWNAGDAGTTLDFDAGTEQGWISVTPASGSSSGTDDKVTLRVTIDRSALEKTITFEGAVTISTASGQSQDIRILARYPEPEIAVSPAELNFGDNNNELTFSVWNGGDPSSALDFNITAEDTWISSITPASGSSTGAGDQTEITVTIDRNVLSGTEGPVQGSITLASDDAQDVTMPVSLEMVPPTADFTADPTSVGLDTEVVFTDTSVAGSGDIVEWVWDFGDDSDPVTVTDPGTLPVQVTHAYETTYIFYTVSLTVRSEYGFENTLTKNEYIHVVPQPATAQFSVSDTTPDMFQVVNFTDKSDPGSGVITSREWDLGDGTTATGSDVVHEYTSHGEFTVTLTITATYEDVAEQQSVSRTITVAQVLPDAEFAVDKKIVYTELDPLTFTDQSTIPAPWVERIATWCAWRDGIDDMPTPWQPNYSGDYWTGTYEADITDGLYYYFFDRGPYTCRLIERSKYQADPIDPDDPGASWYTSSEVKDSLIEVRVPSPLDIYCRYDDDEYTIHPSWDSDGRDNNEPEDYIWYAVKFTSQKWVLDDNPEGPPVDDGDEVWEHWLTMIVPDPNNFNSENRTAVLYVEGGNNGDDPPAAPDPYLLEYALQTGHVVASVHQVPNQPIGFTDVGELSGHEIIAHSFRKCMDTGDTFWPAVFPMAKSVVMGMTAVQDFLGGRVPESPYAPNDVAPVVIKDFVLAGADIQAWAIWLAGAHDERVRALIPMVFDFINIRPRHDPDYEWGQISYQAGPFDDPETPQLEFSEVWAPYTASEFFVFDRIEPVSRLNSAFSMKRYRKRFEMHMRDVIIGSLHGDCAPDLVRALSAFMLSRPTTPCYDPHYSLAPYLLRTVDAVFPVHPDLAARGYTSYSDAVLDAAETGLGCPSQPMNPRPVTGGTRPLFGGSSYGMDLVIEAMLDYETMQYYNNIEGWLSAMVDPFFYGERYGYWYSEQGGRLGIPKCIISSPGSVYYVPTSVQPWLGDMNGQNYFRYMPNTDHYLNETGNDGQNNYKDAFMTTLPWFQEFLAQNGNPVVPFRWGASFYHDVEQDLDFYLISANWLETENIPEDLEVNLWTALDWTNDFREDPTYRPGGPTWKRTLIGEYPYNSGSGYYPIEVPQNEYLYKSFFLEVSYSNSLGLPVKYTSPGYVLQPKFPGLKPPPMANFEAEPRVAAVGQEIQFTDTSWNPGEEYDQLDSITQWEWDFGDGDTSTLQHPTHTYDSEDQYTVKLTVTNAIGSTKKTRINYITVN